MTKKLIKYAQIYTITYLKYIQYLYMANYIYIYIYIYIQINHHYISYPNYYIMLHNNVVDIYHRWQYYY